MNGTTWSLGNRPVVLAATALFVVWLLMDSSLMDYLPFGSNAVPESTETLELSECSLIQQEVRDARQEAAEVPEDSLIRPHAYGHAALIVTQNPQCFDSRQVADAAALLYGSND